MAADCLVLGVCGCQVHALSLGAVETTLGITYDSQGPDPAPCPAKLDTVARAPEDRCGGISRDWKTAPCQDIIHADEETQSQRTFNPENTLINDQKQNKLFISWILIQQLFTEQLCQALCGSWR